VPLQTTSGNTPPTVTGPGNFNIPKLTPFSLTASATDPDIGDQITYDWQEYDLGAATNRGAEHRCRWCTKPILRPYSPTVSGTRTFPSLQYILNSANVPPATFNCGRGTKQSMPGGRGLASHYANDDVSGRLPGTTISQPAVSVRQRPPYPSTANSGPFVVTSPNTAVSYAGGSTQSVTWNVANTTNAPVSAATLRSRYQQTVEQRSRRSLSQIRQTTGRKV